MTTQTRAPEPTAQQDDASDVDLVMRGDAAAFERIYRRHAARIHTLAGRMVGPEAAEELTQDVFVRAWQKLDTFRAEAAFGTWLYRLAINVILAARSSAATRRLRFVEAGDALDVLPARRARPDLKADLDAAIRRLPDGAREIFVLHDVEGYKHHEIADLVGITAGTSKSQLHRARMLLRGHLRGQMR